MTCRYAGRALFSTVSLTGNPAHSGGPRFAKPEILK
jgi:hypothetical protein